METTAGTPENIRGRKKTGRLGEILIKENLITPNQLEQALELQRKQGGRLGSSIVKLGFLTGDEITAVLSRQCGIPSVGLASFKADRDLLRLVPMEQALKLQVLPLSRVGFSLTLAMADPSNVSIMEDVNEVTGLNVEPVVASEASLEQAIRRNYGSAEEEERRKEVEELIKFADVGEAEDEEAEEESALSLVSPEKAAEEARITRLVNYILVDALGRGASDIHLEPRGKEYYIRYRIDGVMQGNVQPPFKVRNAIINQIRTMAKLDPSEKRLPQEGRARIRLLHKGNREDVDFRVSALPTLQGEKIVLRTLDNGILGLDLSDLGLESAAAEKFRRAITRPDGMVLVTGPPKSGKTTTLYTSLSQINRPDINIVTVEDPVEFPLPGINQVQVKESFGLTFATALRATLAQDPDIFMVGAIPDLETAEVAIKAAMTGRLVLSTLPAGDAASAIVRLMEMGVDRFQVATAIHLVCAQRLVRRICLQCKAEDTADRQRLREAGFTPEEAETVKVYRGAGCPTCNNRGYKGRVGFYEVLEITDELRKLILGRDLPLEFEKKAIELGMITLRRAGLLKVAAGITTLEEVMRETALQLTVPFSRTGRKSCCPAGHQSL